MIKKIIICVFLAFSAHLLAQEERFVAPKGNGNENSDDVYDREFTYGLQWATNGGILAGFSFKYTWKKNETNGNYYLIGLDFVHVDHHKEKSARSIAGSFSAGKTNDLLAIRPHFGKEIILFNKAAEEGIQVSFTCAVGPTFGFLKPYFIEYSIDPNLNLSLDRGEIDPFFVRTAHQTKQTLDLIETEKYAILSGTGIFSGFGSMVPHLGLHAKTALNFEYGLGSSVAGIEIGVMSETFFKQMPLMLFAENRTLFMSLFATVYFGFR